MLRERVGWAKETEVYLRALVYSIKEVNTQFSEMKLLLLNGFSIIACSDTSDHLKST